MHVIKRSGKKVDFDKSKILNAIKAANNDIKRCDKKAAMQYKEIMAAATIISHNIKKQDTDISVEDIQDLVEKILMESGHYEIAKTYIEYRHDHNRRREIHKHLEDVYDQIIYGDAKDSDLRRDNANIDTDAPMGQMLKIGTEAMKHFIDTYVLDPDVRQADKDGYIHVHDKDFSLFTFNCCEIDLLKLFKDGFSTGHGFLREPNSIRSAAALTAIAIQSNQNNMFGGQGVNAFDFAMAPYVDKSFVKAVKHAANEWLKFNGFEEYDMDFSDMKYGMPIKKAREIISNNLNPKYVHRVHDIDADRIYSVAMANTEEETKQAMEALIHNLNTLHSRAGSQCPFSSLNFGCDVSPEGHLVIDKLLDAIDNGLGHGETAIFPIAIFQVKSGFNYNPGDPNYDLFEKSCKVSAKRLFPNFVNENVSYNAQYYKPGNYNSLVATMGCRTRVMSNVNGPEESGSRGNFSFATINLPLIALDARKKYPNDQDKRIKKFFDDFDQYIYMSKRYLEKRYEFISHRKAKSFSFLMGQGVWMDSEKLGPEDEIGEVLKHASLSIGFCGLAECLVALVGHHHGESEDAQKLGLKIVGHLREMTDKFTEEEHMNWSTFATPAESTAGAFARACQKKYGKIAGVCDRAYITNSSHLPVYFHTTAAHKVDIEAPYHALENAGHILYVEQDGDTAKNVKAFEKVVRYMIDKGAGYCSINHPVDRDPVCGYTGIIENECPHCHRTEHEHYHDVIPRCCD